MIDSVVLLGVGNVAFHVAKLFAGRCTIYGTSRSQDRFSLFAAAGITPLLVTGDAPPKEVMEDAHVLVSFPPDGTTDAAWSAVCANAKRIIYISSTGVYGKTKGIINEDSPVDLEDPNARKRLLAESVWRKSNGIVLRCPGLYGPETGLHLRLKKDGMKIPGDGKHFVSRIHLDDLARIIEACFERGRDNSTYVVGDLEPSTHLEAITWVCEHMGMDLPGFVDLTEVSPMLRGSRRIDPRKILSEFKITLQYPSYREGYGAILGAPASLPASNLPD